MKPDAVRILNGRTIFYSEAYSGLGEITSTAFATDFIACLFLHLEWSHQSDLELKSLISAVIARGAVFLGFWGRGSERAHRVAETLLMLDNPKAALLPIPVSWEDENSLEQELSHFIFSYEVDEQFQKECSWIVVNLDRCIPTNEVRAVISAVS